MKNLKTLLFGTVGAMIAWLIADHASDDLLKLLGYLIFFNAISFAVSFRRKKEVAASKLV